MSENVLQNIIQKKIEKVDKLKKSLDLKTLDELINKNNSYINFKEKIENNLKKNKTSIIIPAEGLAFLISAIIEVLLLFKLFSIFSLKLIKLLFLSISSFKALMSKIFFNLSTFLIFL